MYLYSLTILDSKPVGTDGFWATAVYNTEINLTGERRNFCYHRQWCITYFIPLLPSFWIWLIVKQSPKNVLFWGFMQILIKNNNQRVKQQSNKGYHQTSWNSEKINLQLKKETKQSDCKSSIVCTMIKLTFLPLYYWAKMASHYDVSTSLKI